jgi:hypothetical protein
MTTIKTNNHWRQFKYRDEVPASILASQFDWTDKDHEEHGDYSDGFLEYRGVWYHLGDFMAIRGVTEPPFSDWTGSHGDSFFSGVLIRLSRDGEEYQIATYYS